MGRIYIWYSRRARIRELRSAIDDFKAQQNTLKQELRKLLPLMNKRQLRSYVNGLRHLLSEGTIFEQKSFINSFIKKITAFENKVILEYIYPVSDPDDLSCTEEVLCSELKSSPGRTVIEHFSHCWSISKGRYSPLSLLGRCRTNSLKR